MVLLPAAEDCLRFFGSYTLMKSALVSVVIFASGSCGCLQSSFDPFFGRWRSRHATRLVRADG